VELTSLTELEQNMLKDSAPKSSAKPGDSIIDVLVASNLAQSKREAREFVEGGATTLSGTKITDPQYTLVDSDFKNGLALVRRGKRNVSVLINN